MKNSIARIIYYSILVALLLIGLTVGILLYSYRNNHTSHTTQSTSSSHMDIEPIHFYNTQYIQDLDIDWTSGSLTLEFADTQNLVLTETGSEPMTVNLDSGTLKLSYPQDSTGIFQNHPSKDLHILVPKDWSCRKLLLDAVSTSLLVKNGTIREAKVNTTSGANHFENCALEQLSIDTISGAVDFDGTLQSFDCDSTSAGVELDIHNCPESIEMDTISGNMTLHLPSDCGFTVKHDSLSGRFDSDFATTTHSGRHIHGDGSCTIEFDGASGSLEIHDRGENAHHAEKHHS